MLKNLLHGFAMALADSVPGVSGGTVAFLLGFYDRFINSVNYLLKGSKEERIEAFKYLVNLGIGWGIGMISAITVLSSIFEKEIYTVSSLFIGFILAAIPVMIMQEKASFKNKTNCLFMIPGMALVVLISLFGKGNNVDVANFTLFTFIYALLAGAAAISAMVLPGISGSTILLTFGLYLPVIQAVKALLGFDFQGLPLIMAIGIGVLVGAVVSVRTIKHCLETKREQTLYVVIGMMIGSLYAIVQGPTTLEVPQAALSLANFKFIPFIIGILIVASMQLLQSKSQK